MGAFLDKPITDKSISSGQGNGLSYGVCCMQGWRVEMEDAHVANSELPEPFQDWSYYGVFDGHAGARVSKLCATNLLDCILTTEEFQKLPEKENKFDKELIKAGIVNGFLAFDRNLLFEDSNEKSGSTAVVTFVTPTHIIIANCGDSRALFIRNNQTFFATEDHKPGNPLESRRISEAGGQVMLARVNGCLAVSRSLGDFEYKRVYSRSATEQLVSPEPDVFFIDRNKETDQLLLLACDGVWDIFENYELTEYVLQRLSCVSSLVDVCSEILDTSLHKGSRDNMSVLIVALDNAPVVNPEAASKDAELEKKIKGLISNMVNDPSQEIDLQAVVDAIKSMDFSNYPPGGLITKRGFIDSTFNACIRQTKLL